MGGAVLVAAFVAWRQWPKQFLRQGEAALAARDYGKAREHLARYLSHRPDDAHALLLAARSARQLNEYYEAFEHLRNCRAAGGAVEAVDVEAALIAVQRGEAPSPWLRRRAEEDDELALEILEALIQHDIDSYRLRQALHGLTRYLEARPDDLQALLARGFVWERFLSFPDALVDYRKAVAAHAESERARFKLAATLLISGTPDEALEQYRWLAQRRPSQPEVRLGLAKCLRLTGELDAARTQLDALVAELPDFGDAHWERGQLALDSNQPQEAELWLRRAIQAAPFDRRKHYSLYLCLTALERTNEAEQARVRVAEIDADLRRLDKICTEVMSRPDDAALRCEGGLLFLRNGEREEGIRWLRMALRLDPRNVEARRALAAVENRAP
jgi:tetratricopeptide (TPR) repeat protein